MFDYACSMSRRELFGRGFDSRHLHQTERGLGCDNHPKPRSRKRDELLPVVVDHNRQIDPRTKRQSSLKRQSLPAELDRRYRLDTGPRL